MHLFGDLFAGSPMFQKGYQQAFSRKPHGRIPEMQICTPGAQSPQIVWGPVSQTTMKAANDEISVVVGLKAGSSAGLSAK